MQKKAKKYRGIEDACALLDRWRKLSMDESMEEKYATQYGLQLITGQMVMKALGIPLTFVAGHYELDGERCE